VTYAVGSLIRARGREWVVLPESERDMLVLRPLGGTEDEVTGVYLPLETVEPATFELPDPTRSGDHRTSRLLRGVSLTATVFLGLWAFPAFWLIDTGQVLLVALAMSVGMVGVAAGYGPLAAYFSELFDARVRYSGAGLSYNLAGILGGAFAPLISIQLLAWTGASWSVSAYVAVAAVVSFVAIAFLSETYQTDLSGARSDRIELADPREQRVADSKMEA